ncbi:MAG: hypothetical protein CMN32_00945 [Saprospirales bacterium]|nr:hypothetical protein [Saprospirales bacterium]
MRKLEFTQTHQNYFGTLCQARRVARFGGLLSVLSLLLLMAFSNRAGAQCALACNDQVNISLPGTADDCELEVTVDMVLEDPTSCNLPMEVQLFDLQGFPLPGSPFVNETHIGKSYIFSVTEIQSGNNCWGTILVEDKLGPDMFNCGNVTVPCLVDYLPTTDGGDIPAPDIDDCSNILSISYEDDITLGNCNTTYVAIVDREWTAIDQLGNTSTCTQHIFVERVSLADYTPVCPANVTIECDGGNPDTSPDSTGYPTIEIDSVVYNVVPGANNFCEIAASYSDEVFDLCGGGQKILRTWTIYDWCLPTNPQNGNPFTCIQVIKIEDTTPPAITCPAPIVYPTSAVNCLATLDLPAATVTDDCSGISVKVLTPFGLVNGNGGLLANVPMGTHPITYSATDACGNNSSCSTTLTIVDNKQPTAVCDEFTTVSLDADGTAIVSASTFDDGSTDNCGVDYFEVRRMPSTCVPNGTPFGAYATFDCCDLNESIMVVMRVFDNSGNYNDCMVEVTVQDKIAPTIICPPNKTIECHDPVGAPDPYTADDNCPADTTITITTTSNLNSCGEGYYTRTYTITDGAGLSASCTQTINVENSDPFSEDDITWPWDYTTDECDPALDPEDLPAGYQEPVVYDGPCDHIAVTYTDQLLPTNFPACFKILRKWIVIDWCQYDPNIPGSPGYWEHTQILKVVDNTPPVLTCPADTVVISLDPNCGFGPVALDEATADDCSTEFAWNTQTDYDSDGSIDAVGSSPNLNGNYPFGKHKVTIEVEDLCGNFSTCVVNIEVKDGKKPTPVCVNGLAVELMPDPNGNGGMVQLNPEHFNQGSYDNCTAAEDLVLALTPNVFTCDDVGTNVVTMFVTDEAGNTDYCETYVIIQDNMVVCSGNLTADVGGAIANPAGSGVQDVLVEVSGNGPLTAPVMTNQQGQFQFYGLDLGHDYTFTPNNNQNPLNGVTTFDMVLMTRHILNVQKLDSPYKIIAADVNHSGSVTTADIVELRKLVLQIIPEFSNNTSWRFVDKDYVFPDPENPFAEEFPEFFNINNLASDVNNVDFVAVKVGDVNMSAVTHNLNGDDTESRTFGQELSFVVDNRELAAGETVEVPFMAKDFVNMQGFQLALQFDTDALELMDIAKGELPNLEDGNFGLTMVDEGIITMSWDNTKNTLLNDNTTVFTLVFKANSNTSLQKALTISTRTMPAEAYRYEGNGYTMLDLGLQFNNAVQTETEFELFQNNPNPFRDVTVIGFNLPRADKATLTVFDLSGKVLTTISENFEAGYNEIELSQSQLGSSGVLLYKLETTDYTATRRMVRL